MTRKARGNFLPYIPSKLIHADAVYQKTQLCGGFYETSHQYKLRRQGWTLVSGSGRMTALSPTIQQETILNMSCAGARAAAKLFWEATVAHGISHSIHAFGRHFLQYANQLFAGASRLRQLSDYGFTASGVPTLASLVETTTRLETERAVSTRKDTRGTLNPVFGYRQKKSRFRINWHKIDLFCSPIPYLRPIAVMYKERDFFKQADR